MSSTRLTSRSHTLIDNIASNVIIEDAISWNIVNTISNHLSQFLILPHYSITPNSTPEVFKETLEISVWTTKFQTSKKYRSSHQRCSVKKGVLRNFAKFTGKNLCQSLFLKNAARLAYWRLLLKIDVFAT